MITYKIGNVQGELKGINSEFDGGCQSTGENLKEFHQKLTGGQIVQNIHRIRAEYMQNAFADLHSEKIG
jgi:hypothetical protein